MNWRAMDKLFPFDTLVDILEDNSIPRCIDLSTSVALYVLS